jgi:hypothetical protein
LTSTHRDTLPSLLADPNMIAGGFRRTILVPSSEQIIALAAVKRV